MATIADPVNNGPCGCCGSGNPCCDPRPPNTLCVVASTGLNCDELGPFPGAESIFPIDNPNLFAITYDTANVWWTGTYEACNGTIVTVFFFCTGDPVGWCIRGEIPGNPTAVTESCNSTFVCDPFSVTLSTSGITFLVEDGGGCVPMAAPRSMSASAKSARGPHVRLPLARPDRCEHLLKRTEFRSGCSGMKCRHGCDLGLPAVPGVFCQACPSYVAEPGVPWLG